LGSNEGHVLLGLVKYLPILIPLGLRAFSSPAVRAGIRKVEDGFMNRRARRHQSSLAPSMDMDMDNADEISERHGPGAKECPSSRMELNKLTHECLVAYLRHALCSATTAQSTIKETS